MKAKGGADGGLEQRVEEDYRLLPGFMRLRVDRKAPAPAPGASGPEREEALRRRAAALSCAWAEAYVVAWAALVFIACLAAKAIALVAEAAWGAWR